MILKICYLRICSTVSEVDICKTNLGMPEKNVSKKQLLIYQCWVDNEHLPEVSYSEDEKQELMHFFKTCLVQDKKKLLGHAKRNNQLPQENIF